MWYKVNKIYVGTQQVRPSWWKPDASRTLLYLPLESNATDQSWNNRSTTASWITYTTNGWVMSAKNSWSGYINLTTSAANYLLPSTWEATVNVRIYRTSNDTSKNRRIFEWEVQNKIWMHFQILTSTYYPSLTTTWSSDKWWAFGTTSIAINTWVNLCLRIKNGSAECFINWQYVWVQSNLNNNWFGAWANSSEQGCRLFANRTGTNNQLLWAAREFIYENTYWSNTDISNYYNRSKRELWI